MCFKSNVVSVAGGLSLVPELSPNFMRRLRWGGRQVLASLNRYLSRQMVIFRILTQGPRNDILSRGLTEGDSITPLKKLNSIFLRRS